MRRLELQASARAVGDQHIRKDALLGTEEGNTNTNLFLKVRLIRGTPYFNQEEGHSYGQSLKTVRRHISAY